MGCFEEPINITSNDIKHINYITVLIAVLEVFEKWNFNSAFFYKKDIDFLFETIEKNYKKME